MAGSKVEGRLLSDDPKGDLSVLFIDLHLLAMSFLVDGNRIPFLAFLRSSFFGVEDLVQQYLIVVGKL